MASPRACARILATRAALLPGIAAVLLAGALAPAHAQVAAGSVGVASQDRYRGLATSDDGALSQLAATAETPWGLYANGITRWQLDGAHWGRSQVLAGWSRSLDADWSVDLAASRMFYARDRDYDMTQWTLSVARRGLSARAWWSRHDIGQRPGAWYLELDDAWSPGANWRVLAHVGHIVYRGRSSSYGSTPGPRTDALAGVAWSHDALDLRLTVDGLLSGHDDAGHGTHRGPAATLCATWAF